MSTIAEHLSGHETGHVYRCVDRGGSVEGVVLHAQGGLTNTAGLRRRDRIEVAVSGRISERLLCGAELDPHGSFEDMRRAQELALEGIKARRRVSLRWKGVKPVSGAMDKAFAAAAEKGILPEVQAGVALAIQRRTESDLRRAGAIVAAAEERVEESFRANLTALRYFAEVLAKMETMDEGQVLATLYAAMERQGKSCSNS